MSAQTLTINDSEFSLLKDLIEQECGIVVDQTKRYLIESRLASLVIENGCDNFGEFYRKAKFNADPSLKDKIVDAMTTNETLWFRDEAPYLTLKDKIFPELAHKLGTQQRFNIRIWSAACSSGQEPYSIGMMAHEYCRLNQNSTLLKGGLSITATDISSSILFVAKNARYSGMAMSRGMLPGFQERYFTPQGTMMVVNEDIRKLVTFQKLNLQDSFAPLGKFDVIFLRNVAIYFSAAFKTELFSKIAQSLNPGGYLILGSSESLMGYSKDFDVIENGRCLYYRVKSA